MSSNVLIRLENIHKTFVNSEGQPLSVLENINFEIKEGEIVAILGKSGSGKSTLLRMIAGLSNPSQGQIYYREQTVRGPAPGIAMVFQNFALLPWLTVLENVELGLEAQGVPRKIRRQQALKAIDTIGMDGFESAYPKELSGGMRQRVGFARAIVVEPDVLLMDEPFSALDILTAENLRNDLLDLWSAKRTRTKGILLVSHDIEEALLMANRVILIGNNPAHIQAVVPNPLPYPRSNQSAEFRKLLDKIYTLLTMREREHILKTKATPRIDFQHPEYAYRLPEVDVSELMGLLEAMEPRESQGRIELLDESPNHKISEREFLLELEAFLTEEESYKLLRTIIDWGRYAEIFAYDYDAGTFSLENPQ
jgi:NitT/TauT family transport system ATP-binding protein